MSGLTISNPIQMAYVIASPNVIPGDTLYLRGGDYVGNFSVGIGGTAEHPVIVRPYENEVVNIIGGLNVAQRDYVTFRNLNILQPANDLSPVYIARAGVRFEDCNLSGGWIGVRWFGSGTGALLRCNISNTASYGIYTHNHVGGLREITDCVLSNIGGYYALHMYSESANNVRDYAVSGCTFPAPSIVHAPLIANVTFSDNDFLSWLKIGNGYSDSDTREVVVSGNRFSSVGSGLTAWSWSSLEAQGNNFEITTDPETGEKTNVFLLPGNNLVSTLINNNTYYGGDFNNANVIIDYSAWQALDYDAQGNYTP